MNIGKVVQVVGAVVDVEFPQSLPPIYNALTVDYKVENEPVSLTLEVQQHLGDRWVRTISMSSTDGIKRGFDVTDSAETLIKELTLEYNKLRQGNITKELLEIAGGQAG